MTATFPTGIKTYLSKTDYADIIYAEHINSLQDEITAIETALGAGFAISDVVRFSTANQFGGLTFKQVPANNDRFLIEDSIDSFSKKYTDFNNVPAYGIPLNESYGATGFPYLLVLSSDILFDLKQADSWLASIISQIQAIYYPTSFSVSVGTLVTGTTSDLADLGGTTVDIQEAAPAGISAVVGYTGVSSAQDPNTLILHGNYDGGTTHQILVQAYNYSRSDYDTVGIIAHSTTMQWYSFPIFGADNYNSGGAASIRFLHSGTGVGTHHLYLDYVILQFVISPGSSITQDHGQLAGLADDDHSQYLLADGTRPLTANWDVGSFLVRAQQLQSDIATGTAPLIIASATLVSNLNADLLDGQHASDFGAGGTTDHGSLGGLTDDDHTQYAKLTGRSGGQTLQGGTAASENLTLQSTADVTKGLVIIPSGDILVLADTTSDAFQAEGIIVNQESNDDTILNLKSSDVAHGVTSIAETDTFGRFQKMNATAGGCELSGWGEDTYGAAITGIVTNTDSAKSTAALGDVLISGRKKSGTSFGDHGADQNIISVRCRRGGALVTVAVIDEDGDVAYDGATGAGAWDEHDDVGLLTGLRASVMEPGTLLEKNWESWIEYAKPILQETGVVHYNEDGHHFISSKKLNMLLIDTIRQLNDKVERMQQQMDRLLGEGA